MGQKKKKEIELGFGFENWSLNQMKKDKHDMGTLRERW